MGDKFEIELKNGKKKEATLITRLMQKIQKMNIYIILSRILVIIMYQYMRLR